MLNYTTQGVKILLITLIKSCSNNKTYYDVTLGLNRP